MKYFRLYILIAFISVIVVSVFYTYLFNKGLPNLFKDQIHNQQNPFVVSKDSSSVVWSRAKRWLVGMDWLIQRPWQVTDTSLLTPYIKGTKKGVSIEIERRVLGDSVMFTIFFWNNGNLEENGSKEIALFMNKGIRRSYVK